MADSNVIPLPRTERREAAMKRAKPGRFDPEKEEVKRRRNAESVAALGQRDSGVKLLEELVFGTEDELLHRLLEEKEEEEEPTGAAVAEDKDEESPDNEDHHHHQQQQGMARKGVWVDEDDELEEDVDMTHRYRRQLVRGGAEASMSNQKLQQRMKEQFVRVMGGTPFWAESSERKTRKTRTSADDEDDDDEHDLLTRTGNFVACSDRLPCGVLRMKKCLHANSARPSDDRLTSVHFHPSAQVVLTAGLDQSLSLFQVDGKTNPKIQSVHLERFPVHRAAFSADGTAVIATSLKNKMFYVYDMMEGRVTPVHAVRGLNEARVKEFSVCPEGGALLLTGTRGYLHFLTLKTKEVTDSIKVNGDVSGVTFTRDGSKVFVQSEQGQVYMYDVRRASRCVSVFSDDGCVRGTSIAASPDGRYLACGSQSGVVNIYSQEACLNSANPKPVKAVKNLLTSATSLTFNPSSEILAIASRAEDEAVRLVHLSSLSVFSNFPVAKNKSMFRVSSLDFSPHSGFFSLANNKGHAPLFRLLHYKEF
ncbi:U3 small nucleolar RNA-associated protein 18 homolog isoform X1 [Solea solea]|uniref:U3 small nucleolar RNA-associated protein 18 homolog isoform X1 n=1 Tax=Solea solea TaxID=90069 RepID=UPI00272B429F|nr:U3 small nucleolar RNA-associated protein 18 homolog isoform X1 [Solea solea]